MKFKRNRGVPNKPGYPNLIPSPKKEMEATQTQHYPNILALDVHFGKLGWAIFANNYPIDCGVIMGLPDNTKKGVRVSDDYVTRASFLGVSLAKFIKENNIRAIVGELPSGGAQNAMAMAKMCMSIAICGVTTGLLNTPAEWTTPGDVKIATCGINTATKMDMMNRIVEMFDGSVKSKKVKQKITKNYPDGWRFDYTWDFCGHKFGSGLFEHIADACGSYLALQDAGNLIKLLGGST